MAVLLAGADGVQHPQAAAPWHPPRRVNPVPFTEALKRAVVLAESDGAERAADTVRRQVRELTRLA
jgi:hypothetical protein